LSARRQSNQPKLAINRNHEDSQMETNARPNIAGLVVGGLFAAPFAALLCRKLPGRCCSRRER
jgi:hypothetical protein